MSDVQHTGDSSGRKRKSSPPPSVDSSASDSLLPSRHPEAESTASAAADVSSYWRPAGWSQLTTDLLECITDLLPLRSLPSASIICRGWLTGISAMRARADPLYLRLDQLLRLLDSPLQRHVASLTIDDGMHPVPSQFRLETVHLLRLPMNLTSLSCMVDWLMKPHHQFQTHLLRLPMSLREVDIVLRVDQKEMPTPLTGPVVWSHLERALAGLTEARSLTSLKVGIDAEGHTVIQGLTHTTMPMNAMRSLVRLRDTLEVLFLAFCAISHPIQFASLTRAHIDLLRSMHRLTRLHLAVCTAWSPIELEWLTAEPMGMRLEWLFWRHRPWWRVTTRHLVD